MIPAAIVAMALTQATATQTAAPYRAQGSAPSWTLTIGDGRMRYEPAGGETVDVAAPTPTGEQGMREYRTRNLSVTVFAHACAERPGGERRTDTVWVQVGRSDLHGCGGRVLAADDLTDTSWHFAEIAGEAVPLTRDLLRDDAYSIDFGAEGFVGYGGCNRFSAAYSRSGDMLTAHAPWGSTAGRCSDPVMARERRLMQILTAPVRISLPDPDTLLLTGEQGVIRLRRTPDRGF